MNYTLQNDDAPCRLAVVTGHAGDAETIASRMKGSVANRASGFTAHVGGLCGHRAVAAAGGPDAMAAARVLDAILVAHRPQLVVSAGLASGLVEAAAAGAVIVATEVVSDQHKRLELGTGGWRPPGVQTGPVLSLERPIRSAAQKQALAAEYAAIAIDRHAFVLAQECAAAGVPFVVLLAVTDGPDDELPEDIQFLLARKSRSGKAGALAGTLIRSPSHLKHLWKIKEAALKAGETLADWVVKLAEDLE
jgi:adenosylhomocysteine nucleosidase